MSESETPDIEGYSRSAVIGSVVAGFVVAGVAVWLAARSAVFYEEMFRIAPTVGGGGVGTDWVVGNTIPALDFLIALTHAADVILGLFVLFLFFVHWSIFRQLASRMRQPAVTDGGDAAEGGERP